MNNATDPRSVPTIIPQGDQDIASVPEARGIPTPAPDGNRSNDHEMAQRKPTAEILTRGRDRTMIGKHAMQHYRRGHADRQGEN